MSRESDRAPRGQVGVHGSCFGSLVCKLQWFLTTKSRKSVDKGISTYYYLHLQTSATEEPGLEEPPLNVGDVARFLCSVITALCSGKGLNLRAHLSWRQSPGTWQLVFWDYQFYLLLMLQTRVDLSIVMRKAVASEEPVGKGAEPHFDGPLTCFQQLWLFSKSANRLVENVYTFSIVTWGVGYYPPSTPVPGSLMPVQH